LTDSLIFGFEEMLLLLLLPLESVQFTLEVRFINGTIIFDVLRNVMRFSIIDLFDLPKMP